MLKNKIIKKIGIGRKITFLLLLVVAMSVLAISYLAYWQIEKVIAKSYAQNFEVLSTIKSRQIQATFSEIKGNASSLSASPEVISHLNNVQYIQKDSLIARSYNLNLKFSPYLRNIISNYRNVAILDLKGRVVYKGNELLSEPVVGENYPDYELIREFSSDSLFISQPKRVSNTVHLYVASPVKNTEGMLLGVLILDVDLSISIYPLVTDSTGLGKTGEILLCSKSKTSNAVKYISPLRNHSRTILTESTVIGNPSQIAVQNASQNHPPDYTYDHDYNEGHKVLAFWNFIPEINWGIVVKINQDEIDNKLNDLVENIFILSIIIVVFSSIISMIFSRYLTNPLSLLKSRMELIAQGILPEKVTIHSRDEIEEMSVTIQEMVNSLKETANFAHQIGKGDFQAFFNPLSEKDTLGNALIRMRDSIQDAEKKDKERNWIVTGVAEIGQILRLHNSLEELGDDITSFVSGKINAVQGAFYIVSDEEEKENGVTIDMKASYAYNKKKYLKASFKQAEGLVGQCVAEKDVILRTEIPTDFVTISSGILGDKKPTCLLFVPLIANEEVFGVLEFASFDKFNAMQIDFVKEISLIIARTIFNIKVNERTIRLLQESQKMSQELKYQQEILRQNAEEMEATQEELKRTNSRLEDQVMEVKRAQKRMQVLLENASEVITIYEQNGRIRYISPSVETILGYKPEEMIGITDIAHVHPQSTDAFRNMFQHLLDFPNEQVTIQYEYKQKYGKTLWLEATGTNLLHDSDIQGLIVNSRDITERRRAEKEERMRSQMQALSENSHDLIMRVNNEGSIFYINPIIKQLTGQDQSLFLSKSIEMLSLPEEILKVWKQIVGQVNETLDYVTLEMEFPSLDGLRVMVVNAIPEFNETKQLESILIVSHDITERKKSETQLKLTNKKVRESINYAKRIQEAILPSTVTLQNSFPKSFIFYKPRDVVSGDFPWVVKKGEDVFVAAVDCTGHGVPGALISLIGYFLLNDIINAQKVTDSGVILDRLHKGVTKTLKQDDPSTTTRDGMDIGLLKVNREQNILQFSGAHRPLYMLSPQEEFIEIRGNKFPIGGGEYRTRTNFTTNELSFEIGSKLFIFSDGFPDQFGGESNRKFTQRKIRELIKANSSVDMSDIYNIFEREFNSWQGERVQTDDVLMIGLKL